MSCRGLLPMLPTKNFESWPYACPHRRLAAWPDSKENPSPPPRSKMPASSAVARSSLHHVQLTLLVQEGGDVFDLHSVHHLQRVVAVPNRDGSVLDGVEVNATAEWRADLVHASVSATDRARLVVEDVEAAAAAQVRELFCLLDVRFLVLQQRHHAQSDGRHARREAQDRPRLATDLVLVVGAAHEGEEEAVDAERRLDDVGHEASLLAGHLVVQRLAAGLGVLLQVVLAACSDTEQLLLSEGVPENDVRARAGVVRKLVALVDHPAQKLFSEADSLQEVPHLHDPFLLHLLVIVLGIDEVLDLHLLELPRAEQELPRRDLVAECLADLSDAERHLHPRDCGDILEVHEDTLCGLGPQVAHR
mmetsp:Transcript_104568/g.300627  ORF Transcript_104568/g.300627 Transcript_104568/m.300627 type:complete len:362 (+) Transcript_104568:208-1293(+)